MNHRFARYSALLLATLMASCASNDSPPIRRVSATEFMRSHTFKGLPTDQFIGTTKSGFSHSGDRKPHRAFKQISDLGFFHSWAVIWCPVDELPEDYLRKAATEPNRSH